MTTPAGDEASVLARMSDPFEDEAPVAGQDRRVSALARHCGSASDGLPAYDWYQTTLELWRQAEAQSRADAGMGGHAN